jgi:DNA-directed RNA polymerase subunit RPC12/RpoP
MNGSLYLFPENAFAEPPDLSIVLDILTNNGLLAKALGENRFLTGDNFFRYVSFAGCSPSLQLEPPEDGSDNFTHINLTGPFPQPRLVTAKQYSRPRCPHCGQRIINWKFKIVDWQENPAEEYLCTECNQQTTAAMLDWRRYAACGRLLVEICHVFPGEAMPGDSLMTELEKVTGCDWRYAWADSTPLAS